MKKSQKSLEKYMFWFSWLYCSLRKDLLITPFFYTDV